MRYFQVEAANRTVAGLNPEPYDIEAGTLMGVLAVEDSAKAEEVANLSKNEVNGVEEISPEKYEDNLKKKALSSGNSDRSRSRSPQTGVPLKGKGAVVVEEPEPTADEFTSEPELEGPEDALKLEPRIDYEVTQESKPTTKVQ